MTNRRGDLATYQPFRTQPLLADGLLAVPRQGGELLQKVSGAMFRLAEEAGEAVRRRQGEQDRLDQVAGRAGARRDIVAAMPDATIEEGPSPSGPHSRARGSRFAPEVNAAIDRAAAKHGVPRDALFRFAQIESGGDPNAWNPSGATGLFQFMPGTAKQYGLTDRKNADASADAAARLYLDNTAYLRRQLGREPTAGEAYLAHQQGAGGAAKLLKNPNARASDIVGAKAVAQNGGRAGMSAGDFAGLWTRRVDEGYVLPNAAPTAPGRRVKLSGGTWRPSGQDTVYGRAYDEEGARLYLSMLNTELLKTTDALGQKYKNDPEGLQGALQDLHGQLLHDHVYPEIQPEFEQAFTSLATKELSAARAGKDQQDDDKAKAEGNQRLADLGDVISQKLTGGDQDGAARALSVWEQNLDVQVDGGQISAADAGEMKRKKRNETALAGYMRQADAKTPGEIDGMAAALERDWRDGGIAGLDADGYANVVTGLGRLKKQKLDADASLRKDLRSRGNTIAVAVADGIEPDPKALDKLMLDGAASAIGRDENAGTAAKIAAARAVRDMTVADAQHYVAAARKQFGANPTEAQARAVQFAQNILDKKKKAISTDPLSYAEKTGLVRPTVSLAGTDASTIAGTLPERVEAAEQAAEKFGIVPRYLKAGEASAIAKQMRADPATGADLASAIVSGAGARAPAVLAELGQDAPVIAESGAILADGGSAQAAEDVIRGYGKSDDGKALTRLKPATQRDSFVRVTGGALALAGRDAQRIERAAGAITRTRLTEQGLDPDSDEAQAIHAQAVNEAAGAVIDRGVQYGGFAPIGGGLFGGGYEVLVPSGVRADRFEDVVNALTDEDLAELRVKPKTGVAFRPAGRGGAMAELPMAETLRRAKLVASGNGYAFALGDPSGPDPQFIMGSDGAPFILSANVLRAVAIARVPGATR